MVGVRPSLRDGATYSTEFGAKGARAAARRGGTTPGCTPPQSRRGGKWTAHSQPA